MTHLGYNVTKSTFLCKLLQNSSQLIPLWNSYKLCPSQHIAFLESLITLLTFEMLNYDLIITLVM